MWDFFPNLPFLFPNLGRNNYNTIPSAGVTVGTDAVTIELPPHSLYRRNYVGSFFLNLDTLSSVIRRFSGYSAAGKMSAALSGDILMSQLSPYTFANANLKGNVKSRNLVLYSQKDSLDIYIDSLDVKLGTYANIYNRKITEGERMMGLAAYVDSVRLRYKDQMSLLGRKISLLAQNSAAVLDKNDSSAFYPFGGRLEAGFLSMRGADTSVIAVARSANKFSIMPKKGNPDVPVLDLSSNTGMVFVKGPVNRLAIRNLDLTANAAMNFIERRRKARAFVDSLSKANPDVPLDSLFGQFRRNRPAREIPSWLSETDFRKNDISLDVGENIRKYFREWDMEGSLGFKRMNVMSPFFPLRNRISDFSGTFNNNEINLNGLVIDSGHSNLRMTGTLTGLRMAILRTGFLKLDADVRSDSLDLNQLLAAYSAGQSFTAADFAGKDMTAMEDEEFEEMIMADSTETEADSDVLLVIPANIAAEIKLDARNVRYSKLEMNRMTADLVVKERCVQFTNTSATTNMGDLFFEGFYATQTKKDLKTGFNLNFSKITAEKVIEMLPAIDTVMPLLKSFKGELNLEMAATADIDTTMSILTPTINGVIRIGGSHLQLHNDESIRKIAKILKFRDRENTYIDQMSVEGLISDSRLEIFPFILDIDRYVLAMSGIQNLDSSFKYHVSVIESPLPFRVGIDLWGDFEDMKFKIGKYEGRDDTAFMAEAVHRRICRYIEKDEKFMPLPDLIICDGGAGQIHAVENAVRSCGIDLPVIGLKKDSKHKTKSVVFPDGRELTAEGSTYGYITQEKLGSGGFGYDPVFFSTELGKTFAQASEGEKNSVSHRGRALRALEEKL